MFPLQNLARKELSHRCMQNLNLIINMPVDVLVDYSIRLSAGTVMNKGMIQLIVPWEFLMWF